MRPLTAEQWLDKADSFYQYEASTVQIAEAYAAYVTSFVPDDVDDEIMWRYPIEQEMYKFPPTCKYLGEEVTALQAAARYGASLAGRMEAVRFGKWLSNGRYRYALRNGDEWIDIHSTDDTIPYTTEQLYSLFKNDTL